MSTDRVFSHVQFKYAHLPDNWKFRTECAERHYLNAFFVNNHSKGQNNAFHFENCGSSCAKSKPQRFWS